MIRPMHDRELAVKLRALGLLRGLAALSLGAWVLAMPPSSVGMLTRAVAVYWVVDGLTVFGGSVSVPLSFNRFFLGLRGMAGVVTAVVLLVLPLAEAFGPYRPGQLLLLIVVVPAVVLAVGLQVLAAVHDLLVCFEVRRRIAGEWSVGLSAALSMVFGVLLVGAMLAPPAVLGRGVGAVGVAGGLAVIIGSLRLRPERDPSLSALPH